jgi:hypothetical protein
MATAEIEYVIANAGNNEKDQEAIIEAIGLYEEETYFGIPQTFVPKADYEADVVSLKLIRTIKDGTLTAVALRTGELMRTGVEKHFSDADRERLARYFAGIAVGGELVHLQ